MDKKKLAGVCESVYVCDGNGIRESPKERAV